MIKKIIFLIIILIITLFLLVFYLFDKIYIKKTIANIEDNLNLDISLNTDYEFSFFPNLSLLTKFNLNKKDYNLFIQNAQFYVYKNYDLKPAKFIFNSERIAPIKPADTPNLKPAKIIGDDAGNITLIIMSLYLA